MRAVSPAPTAVQDMDTDHGRLYVAMAKNFQDRADIIAPSSGCVTDKWLLRVIFPRTPGQSATSEPGSTPEEISQIPDIAAGMSEPGAIADVSRRRL